MKLGIFFIPLFFAACSARVGHPLPEHSDHFDKDPDKFAAYWYSGKAELASYDLVQNRYGEDRNGSAVLIFVTEPFSGEKQVKLDDPSTADAVTVMKLNFTRNFTTGIYPYSMIIQIGFVTMGSSRAGD